MVVADVKSNRHESGGVAEKIRRLEENAPSSRQRDEGKIQATIPNTFTQKKQNEMKEDMENDSFWSLSRVSPLTSNTSKAVTTRTKLKSATSANNIKSDAGDESSLASTEKTSAKKFKKIRRRKSGSSTGNLDNSTETFSSTDSTVISKSERKNKKKKKSKFSDERTNKTSSTGDDSTPLQPTRRKSSIEHNHNGNNQELSAPNMEEKKQPSSPNSPQNQSYNQAITRAVSSPNLITPTDSIKKKLSMAQFSPRKRGDVSPTNNGSPIHAGKEAKPLHASISPNQSSKNNSPIVSDTPNKESNKKLSPWKKVDVSPADSTASAPKMPSRALSPIPGPPLSLENSETPNQEMSTTKEPTPKKFKPPTAKPKKKTTTRTSLPPPPQRGIARALSSPVFYSPAKKSKRKVPILATSSKPPEQQSVKGLLNSSRRVLDRTTSSPALSSSTKKKEKFTESLSLQNENIKRSSSAPVTAIAARLAAMHPNKDDRPKKHKPISRGSLIQSSSSMRLVRRSSSRDDAIRRTRGCLQEGDSNQSIGKVSLRPQSGRHLERNLSYGNIKQPENGRARLAPVNRGVKRYSSAPTTPSSSSNLDAMQRNGRGILRSISEDSVEDHSSPTKNKSTTSEASRRANFSRTHSVPVMSTEYGWENSQKPLGNTNRPPPRRRRINRTRSDDVSSLAKSLHEPMAQQRRNSFDEPRSTVFMPQGILRNSSSHDPALSSSQAPLTSRNPKDQNNQNTSNDLRFASSADVYYTSSDDEDDFSLEDETVQFEPLKTTAATSRPGLSQALSGSNLNLSIHSFMTTRSMLSVDKAHFSDDPQWKQALRWLRLLPPHEDEKPLKKKIRIFTWLILLFDFIAAMVAVTTYDGATMCCGEPIFSMLINLNWDVLFRVITYLYLILIFAEIIPVVRQGLPFNILNPTLGFAITFAMFFDDSVVEAVAMWVIEATAIFFEFLIYRTKARLYHEEMERLAKTDSDLAELNKSRKESKRWLQKHSSHGGSLHGSQHSMSFAIIEEGHDSNDDSMSGNSFGENDSTGDFLEKAPESRNAKAGNAPVLPVLPRHVSVASLKAPRTAKTADMLGASGHSFASIGSRVPMPGERREMRLLRERRILRQRQQTEARELKIHFIGTCINIGLIAISLVLIITIASTGGLCVFNEKVRIFSTDQLKNCNQCVGATNICQVCNSDGSHQCYYPYY